MRLPSPTSYRAADAAERRSVCNGCGTKGWRGWIVPETVWGLRISEACDIHDWMYRDGLTTADKVEADKQFLSNMRLLVDRGSKWLKWPRYARTYTYYCAVKYAGGKAFWKGKPKP